MHTHTHTHTHSTKAHEPMSLRLITSDVEVDDIKINEQKPQLNRVGRTEERALTPYDNSRAQQEERLPLLSWQEFSQ